MEEAALKAYQAFTIAMTFLLFTSCVLIGYVLKANFPWWNGRQWHFWTIGVVLAIFYYLAVRCQ